MVTIVNQLRKKGHNQFRILVTTYTNTLIKSSDHLLQQLLGSDIRYVEVTTADKIVMMLLGKLGKPPRIIDHYEVSNLLQQAVKIARFDGNALQQKGRGRPVGG